MSGPPERLPLIVPPSWLRDRAGPERAGPRGGKASAKSADAWLASLKPFFSTPADKAFLQDLIDRGVTVKAFDRIYFKDPYFDGKKWTTKPFEAAGSTGKTSISMIRSGDPAEDAATLYHEGIHTAQPDSMRWSEKEYEAYVKEDHWRIAHGLPPSDPDFRTTDSSGRPVTNEAAIRASVDADYPIKTTTTSTGAVETVIGRDKAGDTIVERDDGTSYTRPPEKGDTFDGPKVTEPKGGIPVDLNKLK